MVRTKCNKDAKHLACSRHLINNSPLSQSYIGTPCFGHLGKERSEWITDSYLMEDPCHQQEARREGPQSTLALVQQLFLKTLRNWTQWKAKSWPPETPFGISSSCSHAWSRGWEGEVVTDACSLGLGMGVQEKEGERRESTQTIDPSPLCTSPTPTFLQKFNLCKLFKQIFLIFHLWRL